MQYLVYFYVTQAPYVELFMRHGQAVDFALRRILRCYLLVTSTSGFAMLSQSVHSIF